MFSGFGDLSIVFLTLSAILLGLNFICWIAFRYCPSLLVSENERLRLDYLSRVETKLKDHIPEWFEIEASEWPDFAREYRAGQAGAHIYDDFVVFKHPPKTGRYTNRHPAGFRHGRETGPWPISPEFYNIFFFGSSTTLGVGPDWTTVPSYMQDALNRMGGAPKPVRVYNFGRGSYFSTQERILFQQLLLQKAVPDMVVFLGGANDFFLFEGRTVWFDFLRNLTDTFTRENDEARENQLTGQPKWQKLEEFFLSLPLIRMVEIVGQRLARRGTDVAPEQALYRPAPISQEALQAVIDRYLENKKQVEAICDAYGIRTAFVWQPSPAYKYDLRYHVALNLHYGLGGHERSGPGSELMYQLVQKQPLGENFIWQGDLQENEQIPLYLDNMHFTAGFSRKIGEHIGRAVVDRGLMTADLGVKELQ